MKSLIPLLCTIFVITTIVGVIETRETPRHISKALIQRRSDKVFTLAKRSISENHNDASHVDSVEKDIDASRKIRRPSSPEEDSDEAPTVPSPTTATTKQPLKKKGKVGESGGGGFPGYQGYHPGYLPMAHPGIYPGYPGFPGIGTGGYPGIGTGYDSGYKTPMPVEDSESVTEKPDKSKKQKPKQKPPNYFGYPPYAGAYPYFV